jgi:hypothetical protein
MNAAATPVATTAKTIPMQVLVRGRIDAVRRHDKTTYTRIITPAPDPYSRPQTVEIRSKQRLGQPGDQLTQLGLLGGYARKPFRITDKETCVTSMVTRIDMTLDAVE